MKMPGMVAAFNGKYKPGRKKDGKVPMLSEEWWEHMQCTRLNEGTDRG